MALSLRAQACIAVMGIDSLRSTSGTAISEPAAPEQQHEERRTTLLKTEFRGNSSFALDEDRNMTFSMC